MSTTPSSNGPGSFRVKTDRLTLRLVEATDAPIVARALGDEQVWTFMASVEGLDAEDLADAFAKLEAASAADRRPAELCWVAYADEDGSCIGTVRLVLGDPDEARDLEVLTDRAQWNNGFGPEMVRGVFALLRREFGVRHLTAAIDHENERSVGAARSGGMTPLAQYRGHSQTWVASVAIEEYLSRHQVMIYEEAR